MGWPERKMSNSKKKNKGEDKEKPEWVDILEKIDRGNRVAE